ncbi:MAG: protein arginine kinase [Planctomycetota bacterium]
MTFDDLIQTTGEWLRGSGPQSEVVLSSRVRLARNLADQPFLSTASASERTEIFRFISHEVLSLSSESQTMLIDVDRASPLDRQVLVERHLISRQHAAGEGSRGVSISPEETRAVMINEEDHLRIQTLRSGLRLDEAWEELNELDDRLSERVAFAFDQEIGYLTACPTNVGTGIRVSVMLHLPAVTLTKDIERVARAARDMRLAIRGMYGEGTEAIGDLYQISNQTTLGHSEEDYLAALGQTTIPKIVEYELLARNNLAKTKAYQLDDKIWRAYGILTNVRRITSEETQMLLSPIRMGIHMDRFHELDLATLNEVFLHSQSAHLQKLAGRTLGDEERAIARANYLRKKLSG